MEIIRSLEYRKRFFILYYREDGFVLFVDNKLKCKVFEAKSSRFLDDLIHEFKEYMAANWDGTEGGIFFLADKLVPDFVAEKKPNKVVFTFSFESK